MDQLPIKKIKINDVFTIITHHIPTAQSCTFGFWCDGGASKETEKNNGIAHALEHMLFKGTNKRTNKELMRKLDQLGAYSNAYTSDESVAYYLSVAPTDLVVDKKNNLLYAAELLFEMLLESIFPSDELTKEKDVIIQELRMYQDDLESRCGVNLKSIAYAPGTYLHREIIGTEELIKSFTSEDLKNYMKENYNNIYFVVVGKFDDQLIDYAKSMGPAMASFFQSKPKQTSAPLYLDGNNEFKDVKSWANQAQAMMSWKSISSSDKRYPVASLISCILGGGMSSTLFQKVRDDLGLVYSIYSSLDRYIGDGMFYVHFKTFNDKVDQVVDIVNREVVNFLDNLTENQIEIAKNYITSSRIKRCEGIQAKCFFLGEAALIDDNDLSFDDYMEECKKVTRQDIEIFCKEFLCKPADKVSKILTE